MMLNDIDVNQHSPSVAKGADVKSHYAMSTLGERWREAREDAGLGVNELDRLLGQTSGVTSRVEADAKPQVTMVMVDRAARVLRVRLDWLVRGEGPKRAPDSEPKEPLPPSKPRRAASSKRKPPKPPT